MRKNIPGLHALVLRDVLQPIKSMMSAGSEKHSIDSANAHWSRLVEKSCWNGTTIVTLPSRV
jgi:hypothetical protein